MTRATESPHLPASSNTDVVVSVDGHVCPFCGLTREIAEDFDPATPCPRCTLADTPATRSATKARIGPWHVRQVRNPWAPGMGFETLLALVKRGQVTKDSIVRGPTTHQLWKRACEIKGLSREFGVCFSCQAEIDAKASLCPHCNRLQEAPINPDVLVEGREPVIAPAPAGAGLLSAKAQTAARMQMTKDAGPEPVEEKDQSQAFEIGSSTPDLPPDEMLAADEAALARQITTRPPVATPMPPPPARPPRSLRPRAAGVDDALLTPQELAQAFQLGFAPTNSAGEEQSGGRSKLAIAIILLLVIGGAAALASLHPDVRRSASRWMSETWSRLQPAGTSRLPMALPGEPPELPDLPAATTQPAREPLVIAPPSAPEPRTVEVVDPPPLAAPKVDEPTTSSAAIPPAAEIPAPPPRVVAQLPSPLAVDVEITAPDPANAVAATRAAASETAGDPEEQVRTLWRKAIDAEVNQDYVLAVECYEKIKKLPADVQPWGLDLRLEQARKLAK